MHVVVAAAVAIAAGAGAAATARATAARTARAAQTVPATSGAPSTSSSSSSRSSRGTSTNTSTQQPSSPSNCPPNEFPSRKGLHQKKATDRVAKPPTQLTFREDFAMLSGHLLAKSGPLGLPRKARKRSHIDKQNMFERQNCCTYLCGGPGRALLEGAMQKENRFSSQ